jgi:ABC-type branched-subunit amino acid transport system ATPase component
VSPPALETRGLCRRFGGLTATNDVSLTLEEGARHALIGPNGAGKTTLVNLLSGVLKPSSGAVLLAGEDITALSAPRRVRRGLVRTFQINQLFPDMSPAEQLCLAVGERRGDGANWRALAGADSAVVGEVEELLRRFDLIGEMDRPARALSYGKQRLLEIALALARRPRTLLLDEPTAGVPVSERAEVLAALAALPVDVTILLIEHDMDLVFRFATRISVLVAGRLLMEGAPGEVAADPRVREAYLGTDSHG